MAAFHVLPEYRELETEADQLRARLSELSNQNAIDTAAIRHIDAALNAEEEPAAESFDELYRDAAVVLPDSVKRRYEEVREFHASVKERLPNFDLNLFVLPVRLSDAKEDGGLYGFRFD